MTEGSITLSEFEKLVQEKGRQISIDNILELLRNQHWEEVSLTSDSPTYRTVILIKEEDIGGEYSTTYQMYLLGDDVVHLWKDTVLPQDPRIAIYRGMSEFSPITTIRDRRITELYERIKHSHQPSATT